MSNEGQAPAGNPDLANTLFPPPPAYWKAFTDANVARYTELGGPSGTSKGKAGPSKRNGTLDTAEDAAEAREDLNEDNRRDLAELQESLEKPRSDWVVEEGKWLCFGQPYSVSCDLLSAGIMIHGGLFMTLLFAKRPLISHRSIRTFRPHQI